MLESDPLIYSVDTPNGRYYQNDRTGKRLWSVTTVLGRYFAIYNDGGLELWKQRVGEAAAEGIKIQAGKRGSALHDIIEKYVKGEDWRKGQMPINLILFKKFQQEIDRNVQRIDASEYCLFDPLTEANGSRDLASGVPHRVVVDNKRPLVEKTDVATVQVGLQFQRDVQTHARRFNTAGKLDMLPTYCGVRSLMDFKTARKRKKVENILSYFYQAETYAQIWNRQHEDLKVLQTVIMIANDDDLRPQVFVKPVGSYLDEITAIYADQRFNYPVNL